MSIRLTSGANTVLPGQPMQLTIVLEGKSSMDKETPVEACAFLLGETERVRSSADAIFRHRPAFPNGAIRLETFAQNNAAHRFQVHLDKVPKGITKIVFALGFTSAIKQSGGLCEAWLRVLAQQEELIRYELDPEEDFKAALILGELYRHRGDWKFRAVGQGFEDGLTPLAEQFGADLSAPQPPPPPTVPPPLPVIERTSSKSVSAAQRQFRSGRPKRSRGVQLLLVGTAGAAVLMLNQCSSNEQVRYRYDNLQDCVEEWEDDDYCYYDDGHYYAPRGSGYSSYRSKRLSKGKAVSISRGGFGQIAGRFSGIGS